MVCGKGFADTVGRENVIAGLDCGFATFATMTPVDPPMVWARVVRWRQLGALRTRNPERMREPCPFWLSD